MTLRGHVRQARERLLAAGIVPEEAAFDAELLARDVLRWDRASFVARTAESAPPEFAARFNPLVDRRARREPMAYIRGRQEFWGREFLVRPGVLIPRPETEILIEEALAWARGRGSSHDSARIVDIGTGSGCLAVTLALELPGAQVWATDISADALDIARENAARLGTAVTFVHGSDLASVPRPVDLIVSNPPYVSATEYPTLPPEVRDFEPAAALLAGDTGLEAIRQVVTSAASTLAQQGLLLMEMGYGQEPAVRQIVTDAGDLTLLRVCDDLQGIPRVVVATRGTPLKQGSTASG